MASGGEALPTVVIGGAPRCGTTSLFRWLDDHPQACGSKVKETFYLVDRESGVLNPRANYHDHGLAGYAQFFDGPAGPERPVLFEATAGYLYQRTALQVLAELPTQPTLIFLLRQPVRRLLSTYHYFRNNWAQIERSMSFADFVHELRDGGAAFGNNEFLRDAIRHGEYVDHLFRWRERCGEARVVVLVFEALCESPRRTLQRLCAALSIDPAFYAEYDFARRNENYRVRSFGLQRVNQWLRPLIPAGRFRDRLRSAYLRLNTRRHPEALSEEERLILLELEQHYAPYNERLAREFELDLCDWTPSVELT